MYTECFVGSVSLLIQAAVVGACLWGLRLIDPKTILLYFEDLVIMAPYRIRACLKSVFLLRSVA